VTVWANVRPLSGREYYAALAAQIVAEETLVFEIRHRTDVRPGTARVLYESRTYNIRRVAEIGRRDGLSIFADTVEA
jgi:SPP1 family predicted phage head-tail adaptor